MANTGIKVMGIMGIMVTIIKAMADMAATIILVTTMDMVTTMVGSSPGAHPSLPFTIAFFKCRFNWFIDQSGGYGKSPRRGGHTNSYKPY